MLGGQAGSEKIKSTSSANFSFLKVDADRVQYELMQVFNLH